MTSCSIHTDFFDDSCDVCKKEYSELKGLNTSDANNSQSSYNKDKNQDNNKKYKEFTEERAKQLYEDLLLQYLKSSSNEIEAAEKAKGIIRKQCKIRDIQLWPWV
jgi:hypothetical protein